jgi:CDP-diacylglycerol--serine O-phosphatidyltransferase
MGFVARLFKASSEMGKQLDSLADVVSFGVAPAMIFYQFLRLSFRKRRRMVLKFPFCYCCLRFFSAAAGAY